MNNKWSASFPCLHTQRLTLREYRRSDFDAFGYACRVPGLRGTLVPADRQTAWRIFCSQGGLWLLDGAGWWTVEEKETGRPVGTVGAFFRDDTTVMELGWNTYRAFWGQGFAQEAAAAALRHALDKRNEPTVRALIAPANLASLRVAERLGMRYAADTEIYGKAVGIFVRGQGNAAA